MEENKIEIKLNNSYAPEKKMLRKSNIFEKISYISLLISIFLLPLFFIPSRLVIFEFNKIIVLVSAVLIALVFWCLARIKDGKVEFPSTLFFSSALLVVAVYLLSSLFSGNKANSLIGQGFEFGTFGLVFVGFALMLLTSIIFRTKDKIFYSYIAFFISFIFISLFQLGRIFLGSDFLSFGIFNDISFNIIGKWNDLGIYFGLIALLSITTLELTKLGSVMRFFLYFASLASLFFIILINFKVVWFVVGLFAIMFFVYYFSLKKNRANKEGYPYGGGRKLSYLIAFFLLLSAVFIVDGYRSKHVIGDSISNYFKISQLEVRPSFQGTLGVMKSSFKESPALGFGPNRFLTSWLKYKPDGVNSTIFWNFDFIYGVGIIPTFITTTGILGMISWVLFLGLFLYTGFKFIFLKTTNPFSSYLITSSFLASLYFWIMNIFYVPSATLFFLTFFFTGLFVGSLINENFVKMKAIPYLGNPRRGLVLVPLLVLIMISSVTGGYIYFQRYLSNIYFQKSFNSLNVTGNLDDAEKYAKKSISLSKIDSNHRLLTDIYIARLANISSQKNNSNEALSKQFESVLQNAIMSSKTAIDFDKTNYQNYLSAGRLYEFVIPIEGAYKAAFDNYNSALSLNPNSPLINLMLARLEVINKDNVKARDYITKSLQLKNNYTDAVFLLAQIEIAEGNIKNAIKLVEAGSTLTFDNPIIFFQLGILKYSDKERDYKGAAEAFEKALSLNSSYSNARYFLGLSYYNLGKTSEAIKQFEIVQELNQDNKEVELILKNLREGRSPFANATPPIDDKPEKRKTLPVEEGELKETKNR